MEPCFYHIFVRPAVLFLHGQATDQRGDGGMLATREHQSVARELETVATPVRGRNERRST